MKFRSIQVLRGVAALLVVLHHIKGYVGDDSILFSKLSPILGFGAVLFFSISGFLMAYLIDIGYKNFLFKRLLRIYPTFLLITILTIFFKVITFNVIAQPELLKAISLLPINVTPANYPLYGVEWTLIFEIFFYFVCSVFTIEKFKRIFPYFLIAWLGIIIAKDIAPNPYPDFASIFYQIYNMFFIVGGITYYIYKRYQSLSNNAGYILISAGIIYLFSWDLLIKYAWFLKYYLHILALCCVGTLLGSLSIKRVYVSKLHSFMLRLGDYSYTLYLVHFPLLVILFTIYKNKFGQLNTSIALVVLALCVLVGWWIGKVDVMIHKIIKNSLAK